MALAIVGFFCLIIFMTKDKSNKTILKLKKGKIIYSINLLFLLLSMNLTSFNLETEKYVDVFGELIPFFYNNNYISI